MKRSFVGAAVLACAVVCPAFAGDSNALEPGLRFAWSFGAQTDTQPSLSLGLYPNDLGWRRMWADMGADEMSRIGKPAVLDLHIGADSGLRLMGLPLTVQALGLNADGEDASGVRFLPPALIVLAAGAAAALIIGAAGDAAEKNNPADDPMPDPSVCGDGNVVIGDECIDLGG